MRFSCNSGDRIKNNDKKLYSGADATTGNCKVIKHIVILVVSIFLHGCKAQNSPIKEVPFFKLSLDSEDISTYPFISEFLKVKDSQSLPRPLDVYVSNLGPECFGVPVLLVYKTSSIDCGAHGCSLEFYKKINGQYEKMPPHLSVNRPIYFRFCDGNAAFIFIRGPGFGDQYIENVCKNNMVVKEKTYNSLEGALSCH